MPEIYQVAAEELIAEGHISADQFPDFSTETDYKPPQTEFLDKITYDGTQPNAYINSLIIGLKDEVL